MFMCCVGCVDTNQLKMFCKTKYTQLTPRTILLLDDQCTPPQVCCCAVADILVCHTTTYVFGLYNVVTSCVPEMCMCMGGKGGWVGGCAVGLCGCMWVYVGVLWVYVGVLWVYVGVCGCMWGDAWVDRML